MIVLGYSGIHNSEIFTKQNSVIFKGEERIVQGYDSAVAIIIDGEIKACVSEERLTGIKQTGDFPVNAIKKCCQMCNINVDDIDLITHSFNYEMDEAIYMALDPKLYIDVLCVDKQRELWKKYFKIDITNKFIRIPHHLAHIASSYFVSGFISCLGVVCDGMGEKQSMTIYNIDNGRFKKLKEYNINKSLGIFYSVFTKALGYEFNSDEYKVMGLAAYGNPEKYQPLFDKIVLLKEKGDYEIKWANLGVKIAEDKFHRNKINAINVYREKTNLDFQDSADLAASLQKTVEKVIKHVIEYWAQKEKKEKLCVAGGFFLNCSSNGKIVNSKILTDIYCQPAAGDDGSALGAALYSAFEVEHNLKIYSKLPYWGTKYSNKDILDVIVNHQDELVYKFYADENQLIEHIAKFIYTGNIIAWFQNEMEFGPRALGNRSILANPLQEGIQQKLNGIVKFREDFRPFAPAVIEEEADTYFEIGKSGKYLYEVMLSVCKVREKYQNVLVGTTHFDKTARVQIVSKENNLKFYNLIKKFGSISGYSCLINTSFNVKGQPIVESPLIAINTFLKTNIDILCIGNYIIQKK